MVKPGRVHGKTFMIDSSTSFRHLCKRRCFPCMSVCPQLVTRGLDHLLGLHHLRSRATLFSHIHCMLPPPDSCRTWCAISCIGAHHSLPEHGGPLPASDRSPQLGEDTSLRVCRVLSRGAGPPRGCRRRSRTGCLRLRSASPGRLLACWSSRSELGAHALRTALGHLCEQALSTQLALSRKRQPALRV